MSRPRKPKVDAPPTMPEFGTLRGRPIRLADAKATLSRADLVEVEVDVPGQGVIRPWRFASDGSDITVVDGEIVIG